MASWEEAQKRSDDAKAAGGTFLRLAEHGDKFIGAFVGTPHFHDFVWNPAKEQYDAWDKEAEAAGKKKVTRYSINVYALKTGSGKTLAAVPPAECVKIWECNNQTFQDILKVKDKYGLDTWFFEVERNGKKGDSKTTYSILPETKIDPEQIKIIAGLKLHDLSKATDDDAATDMSSHDKKANGTSSAAAPAPASNTAATPAAPPTIDGDTSSKLIGRLKTLPREKIDEFLKRFEIKQVKGLKQSDLAGAEAWITAQEAATAAPDPFG